MFKPGNLAMAGGINLFFLLVNSLVFLIITPLTLNNMGAVNYGIWMILLAFSQLAGLATFGTGSAVEKFIAQSSNENQSEEFSACVSFSYLFLLILGCIVTYVLWCFRFSIAGLVRSEGAVSIEIIAGAIGWMSFGLLPQFLLQVSKGIFLGLVKNFWAGLLDCLQTSVMWIGVFLITFSRTDFVFLAKWIFGLNVFCLLLSLLVLARTLNKHGFHPLMSWGMSRAMLRQSFLTWFSSLGISLFQNVDRILVGQIIGPGAAGIYSLATSAALRLGILLGQFTQVLTPIASRWQADGLKDRIMILYHKLLRFSAWLLFFASSLLIIWMPVILDLWISPEFSRENRVYFQILIFIYALFSLVRPAQQVFNGIGLAEIPAFVFLIFGVLALGGIAFGAQLFGLTGAAAGNFVYCGILVLHFILLNRFQFPAVQWLKELSPPILLAAVFLAAGIFLEGGFALYMVGTLVLLLIFAGTAVHKDLAILNFHQLYDPDI